MSHQDDAAPDAGWRQGAFRVDNLVIGHGIDAPGRAGIVDEAGEFGGGKALMPDEPEGRQGQGFLFAQTQMEVTHHAVGIRNDQG